MKTDTRSNAPAYKLRQAYCRCAGERAVVWNTEAQRRIYCVNLVEALRKTRQQAHCSSTLGSREVRAMADRVLAASARGTTRWSRAIIAGRRMRTARKTLLRRRVGSRREAPAAFPGLQKRLRLLSRLVPGCPKVSSVASLIEEATDYISALEMQVKAMSYVAEILGSVNGGRD